MLTSSYILSPVATNCLLNIKLHNITTSDKNLSYHIVTVATNNHLNFKLHNITSSAQLPS